jgi:hypothetical protein
MKKHGFLLSFLFTMFLISPLPLAAQMQTGIEGHVYLDSEATPAQGVWVDVHAAADYNTWITSIKIDADGYYFIPLTACNSCYKVHYNTQSTLLNTYISMWNEGKQTHAEADSISVQSGNRTFLADAILTEGKKISGMIKNQNDLPVQGVYVQAYDQNGNQKKFTVTNAAGAYILEGLFPDTYRLFFNTLYIPQENLISAWYNNELNEGDAALLHLEDVEEISGKDATLYFGATVSGTVTKRVASIDTPVPVSGAWIGVYDIDENSNVLRGYRISDENGSYVITGLPSSSNLFVQFYEKNYRNKGIGRTLWYEQTKKFAEATPVTVNSTGIDALFEPGKASKLLPAYQQLLLTP